MDNTVNQYPTSAMLRTQVLILDAQSVIELNLFTGHADITDSDQCTY